MITMTTSKNDKLLKKHSFKSFKTTIHNETTWTRIIFATSWQPQELSMLRILGPTFHIQT